MDKRDLQDNMKEMPAQVQATEVQTMLPELLRRVEDGESIVITREGKTVAHLVPDEDLERERRQQVWDEFMRRRATWKKTGMTTQEILDLRHEGHRF